MKILIIGSGGREHAMAWTLSRGSRAPELFCAPGNPGIARLAECLPLKADDLEALTAWAAERRIDLTVVGPEVPLALGIVDRFEEAGLRIVGPSRRAAELEGSKAFAKAFMARHGIPTAGAAIFDSPEAALRHLDERPGPAVVKADGLAAGKGVVVARDRAEAAEAVKEIMVRRAFGSAGDRVVIEECLTGQEVSFLVFTDGNTIVPMATAQDHKRISDGDRGPNTGGMGAFSPSPLLDNAMTARILREVIRPTVEGMAAEGRPFKGILYAGLMLTPEGPKVLEFNCRFGDPETQVILPRLQTDLIDVLEAVADGSLHRVPVKWSDEASVCVVLAAGGYPGNYERDRPIRGVPQAEEQPGVAVFHAGTVLSRGELRSAGGRVLGIMATGEDLARARARAYRAVEAISFEGMQYRRDIGLRTALDRPASAVPRPAERSG